MIIRYAIMLMLLITAAACSQTGEFAATAEPENPPPVSGSSMEGEPFDPRFHHARESPAWRRYEEQLERLYVARKLMRDPFRLPETPDFENEIDRVAWEYMKATEKNSMANMISAETMNDVNHCKNALDLAMEERAAAKQAYAEAWKELTATQKKLLELLEKGDKKSNLEALKRFGKKLPDFYCGLLADMAEDREGEPESE